MSGSGRFLEHYGVKGMKWGQRRTRREVAERKRRQQTLNRRRHLSDHDLDKSIERLQKEKKLKELTEQDLSPGRAATKKILSNAGQKTAATVLSGAMLYGVKVFLTKQFNAHDASNYLAPRPKTK